MDDTNKQAILSAVRSILIALGSVLGAKGYMDDALIQSMIGAVMVVLPVLWGVWDKYQSEQKTKVREVVALNVGIAVADSTVGQTPMVTPINTPNVIAALAPTLPAGLTIPAAPEVQSPQGEPAP